MGGAGRPEASANVVIFDGELVVFSMRPSVLIDPFFFFAVDRPEEPAIPDENNAETHPDEDIPAPALGDGDVIQIQPPRKGKKKRVRRWGNDN